MRGTPKKKNIVGFLFLIIALAVASPTSRSEAPAAGTGNTLALSNLAVPEEIGKVQERFMGSSPRTIIQIQDVHAHATAQQNISAILERLRTVFGIEKAALEGAWTSTSLPKSYAIPTSREKQLLAGTLLEDDLISGPVYAAIMSPEPITLVGIEDEASYEKNRSLFLAHLGKKEEIEEKLRAYGASLEDAQKSTWGPRLLAFGNAFGNFRETSDLGKFFPVLFKIAEAQSVDISDLTQITLLRDLMALEKDFEKERLKKEVKQILKKYKNRPWTIEELVRGGKIPSEEIGLYPEIKKLTLLYKMRDQLSLQDLMDQIATLTSRILEKLVKTLAESALWEKTERFYLARRILLLQATPADIKAYEDEKDLLEAELAGAGLSEALSLSLAFYEIVKKRDEIFFQRIMTDPALAGDIAIVTGGFHTEGLSQKFRDAGISYITVTPDLGDTPMNEKLYNERMANPTQSQTLSELQNAIAWTDERFRDALEVLFQTKDVRKGVKVFRGETVTIPKSAMIRDLAARKQLRGNSGPETISALNLKVSEFTELAHEKQLETVRALLERAEQPEHSPVLISSVNAILNITKAPDSSKRVEQTLKSGDPVALLKDGELPENFLLAAASGRVKIFEVRDGGMDTMVFRTPKFSDFIRHHPPVIVKNGYSSEKYPVLEEKPESLLLYRIITLSEPLYRAAKNPAFRDLLARLVGEVLSQEAVGESA